MKKKRVSKRRTASQYKAFRKSFKKWSDKYKEIKFSYADINTEKGSLELWEDGDPQYPEGKLVTEYIAPDYVKYMYYCFRKFI